MAKTVKDTEAMRTLIAERLDAISNLADKAILRELANEFLLPLYDETVRKYAELERRVYDEVPAPYSVYTVYSTVLPPGRLAGNTYLCAVVPEESVQSPLNLSEIAKEYANGGQPVIETVFLEADYLECRRIGREGKVLSGAFEIGAGRFPFKCVLKPAVRYLDAVIRLYNAFLHNGVPWTTVNAAYFGKFFDVCLTEIPDSPMSGKIQPAQTKVDFGAYQGVVRRGVMPVWNIDRVTAKADDFPMPALDSVNYEYRFDLAKLGVENGFLPDYDSSRILHLRRDGASLVAVSPQKHELSWDMFRFRRRADRDIDIYPYPVLSNARRDSFSERLLAQTGAHIGTRAEFHKRLTAFEASEYADFVDLRFSAEAVSGDSYDMNAFAKNEVRDPTALKTLIVSFKAKQRGFFLNRDIVSFIISDLQTAFPEYRCVGVML